MGSRSFLLYTLCCVLWGSTWLVIKVGLADLPPFLFGGIRMAIASCILLPIAFRSGVPRLRRTEWAWIAAIGLLQMGLSYAAVFAAERFISSGLTAMLFCSYPIWAVILADRLIPGERLTRLHVVSVLLGLSGVVLLEARSGAATWESAEKSALLLPLASSILSATGNVLQKKHIPHAPLTANLWAQTLVGACLLLFLHFVVDRTAVAHWTVVSVTSVLYLSVMGTVVTFLSLFWLIRHIPMVVIGAIPLIDTTLAVALGAVALKESVGWPLVVGGALVLSGAALASRVKTQPEPLSSGAKC